MRADLTDTVGRLSVLGARYLQENIADGSIVGVIASADLGPRGGILIVYG
jgi:hypothetical protein